MKRRVFLGIAIALVVIAAAGVGYSAWQVRQKGDEHDRQAQVLRASRAVDDVFAEIWDSLGLRDKAWAIAVSDPSGSLATMLDMSNADIADIKVQTDQARELIAEIPSTQVQEAYLVVCDELDKALDRATEDAKGATALCDGYQLLYKAREHSQLGWTAVNQSINACNRGKFGEGKELAAAGRSHYEAMRASYEQAMATCGVGSIETAYQYIDAHIKLADLQAELARLGGTVNKYNAQIRKLEEQQELCDSLSSLPHNAEIAVWERAENAYGNFEGRARRARTAWERARDLVSSGEV